VKVLKDILYKVNINAVVGSTNSVVNKIEFDSRKIGENDVFVAISGTVTDGHKYIEKAISDGAIAVICEVLPDVLEDGVTYIEVTNSNSALAYMAANYYEQPSQNLKLVGVTGTNGKTTVTSLLYQLFKKAGYKVGLLSTVKIMVDDTTYKTTHTTPDSLTINKYLKLMNEAGVEFCFMEASSHGIHQNQNRRSLFCGRDIYEFIS
jgi:UDP-N-acetylmuramoyl-L-alanyl-D-glutamate--2,6-diaminopimelate ligase